MTDQVSISIITSLCAVVTSVAAAYFSRQTHNAVNSRMDKFLAMAEESFKAKGVLQEKADANDRQQAVIAAQTKQPAIEHEN